VTLIGGILGGLWLRGAKASVPDYLRPPGARPSDDFLAACIRCGQCVEACPTQILELAHADAGVALGTPYLEPRTNPCDLCEGHEGMRCIEVCPTAALRPVARREDVRMGLAVIDCATCFAWIGVSCRACWHACPFRDIAIKLDELGRAVVLDGCVGCGLCVHACLTEEPAIVVEPGVRDVSSATGAAEGPSASAGTDASGGAG